MPWQIVDWANNIVNTGDTLNKFATFQDGWSWIMENVPDVDNAYDDLFVERCE